MRNGMYLSVPGWGRGEGGGGGVGMVLAGSQTSTPI